MPRAEAKGPYRPPVESTRLLEKVNTYLKTLDFAYMLRLLEAIMREAAEIRVLRGSDGRPIYRVEVAVSGDISVVRNFESKESAQQFAKGRNRPSAPDRKRP